MQISSNLRRGAVLFSVLAGCAQTPSHDSAATGPEHHVEAAQEALGVRDQPRSTGLVVYVGSHDSGDPATATGGIGVFSMNRHTGALSLQSTLQRSDENLLDHPTFLAFDTRHQRLFAVSENYFDPTPFQSSVSSYAADPVTGALSFLSAQETGFSFEPFQFTLGAVHLTVDRLGRHLLVAIFDGPYVQTYPIDAQGFLGPKSGEVTVGSNPHQVVLDAHERTALVPCLGADELRQFAYDRDTGLMTPRDPAGVSTAAGSGPRHLAFDHGERFAYLVQENSATIAVYRYEPTHVLDPVPVQTVSTLPATPGPFDQARAAEIVVSPSKAGFVYVSTRLDATPDGASPEPLPGYVTIYRRNPFTGRLSLVGSQRVGKEPRSMGIDATGRFLVVANQNSDSVVSYRVDPWTGGLTEASSVSVSHPAFAGIVDWRE
jgi:6-phosphogluconolactonase